MSEQPLPPPPPPAAVSPPNNTLALGRGWLRNLMRGIREQGVQPRDPRVKALWELLRRRQLLARDPWARARLLYIWQKGLDVRPRPRTTHRLLTLLRTWGLIRTRPPQRQAATVPAAAAAMRRPMRPLQPVALRRVATLRPVGRQPPMRPVTWRGRGR